jgi:MFS family permease
MRASIRRAGTVQRATEALQSSDFRRLFGIRLVGQCGDGLFQAALVASVVFSPSEESTTIGLFKAYVVIALPFTLIGPFVGVFIDRWSRRRILAAGPLLKAAFVACALLDPAVDAVPFYAGTLLVLSVNRFYLATAQAVVPRLVPTEDLLMANSLATVGGTVALLVGVFVGGQVVDAAGSIPVVVAAATAWMTTSIVASRIAGDLAPLALPDPPELIAHRVRRVLSEFIDGARRLAGTPRAIGPITSITVDQIGQGLVLTLSLVVLREEFGRGVSSFSNLIGAGGLGVVAGIASVGALEDRMPKERIVAVAFVLGGATLLGVAAVLTDWSILMASFVVGLTFAWKKIPVDTLVQEALPDGYRGRVFAVYDVAYNSARAVAAAAAIPMFPALGTRWSLAVVGILFLAWAPVLPFWIGRAPEIVLLFPAAGGRDGDVGSSTRERDVVAQPAGRPVAVRWGGVEEPAETLAAWTLGSPDGPRRALRLELGDGTVLDVSSPISGGSGAVWRIDRERAPRGLRSSPYVD